MDWQHVLNVFLGRLILYILFLPPFLSIFRQALFEIFAVPHRESPETLLAFMNHHTSGLLKIERYIFFSVYYNRVNEITGLRGLSYAHALMMILFSNGFLLFGIYGLVGGLSETIAEKDLPSSVVSAAWLAFALSGYLGALRFAYRLKPAYQKYVTLIVDLESVPSASRHVD